MTTTRYVVIGVCFTQEQVEVAKEALAGKVVGVQTIELEGGDVLCKFSDVKAVITEEIMQGVLG